MLQEDLQKYGYWDILYKHVKILKHIPKKILLNTGVVSNSIYFIEKGCLRTFFYKDGKDFSFQFNFEGEDVISPESFLTGKPSFFLIETIENSIILEIKKNRLPIIFESEPAIKEIINTEIQTKTINYINQLVSFIKDSATERYLTLLKSNSKIIERIPQQYIASYLGITPVSLSRIRSNLKI